MTTSSPEAKILAGEKIAKMELYFTKIVNGFQPLNIFLRKASSYMFDWVVNALLQASSV